MPQESFDVLYCGDTSLESAASYLAGLLHRAGRSFHYVPSDRTINADTLNAPWRLIVLSDYPAARLTDADQRTIVSRVEAGAGLLMIGGWESFHGLGGDWDGTPVAQLLPVEIASSDDRLNCDRPLIVRKSSDHPIVNGLPWDTRPPLLGGLNRVLPKPGAEVPLVAEQWDLRRAGDELLLDRETSHVLLAVSTAKRGRVAAFTSDIAPHWVGPLVDWGLPRVTAAAPNAPAIEVGTHYADLFTRLIHWTGGWI
jgi:uncharacterized membrane protein